MFFLRVRNKVDLSAGNPEFVEKGDMFLTRKKYFKTIRYAMTRGIFRGIFSYA